MKKSVFFCVRRYVVTLFTLCLLVGSLSPYLSADTYAVLSLGTRKDAATWAAGFEKHLRVQEGLKVIGPKPSINEIKSFFSRSDEWLFIAGHYNNYLYNEDESIKIYFNKNSVKIIYDGKPTVLNQGTGFKQNKKLKVLFWGGCNVHSNEATVNNMRSLFGKNVFVGWKGITGWPMVDLNLGGKGKGDKPQNPNFFTVMNGDVNPIKVKDAWLKTADPITQGKDKYGIPYRPRFSVIEASGQEWVLNGKISPNQGIKEGQKFD